jgi:hypothetical protein
LAYQPIMKNRKLIWPHFQPSASFCMDDAGDFLNNNINQPIVEIGPGAHIKGPLVVRDAATGEVIFSVRTDSKLDVEAGSTGVKLFSRR